MVDKRGVRVRTEERWLWVEVVDGKGLGFGGGIVNFRDRRCCHVPMSASGFLLARSMFTETSKTMNDTADICVDKTMEFVSNQAPKMIESVAPKFGEVAAAAADSSLPVAALQYAIDGIHIFTGLNWWASIAITTLIVNTFLFPIMIKKVRAEAYLYDLIKGLSYKEIKEKAEEKSDCPSFKRASNTYMNGAFIRIPVFFTFYYAIEKMVELVPSFTTGGSSWFLDLTTSDPFFILPSIFACSYWMGAEANKRGMEGNQPNYIRLRAEILSSVFYALMFIGLAGFSKAFFCYGIANNLSYFVYGLILKQPSVKKRLKIPDIQHPPQA
ncbi:mitochondrial inner membrane protein OXA1-like [Rutidosis leptorrhynchoides]|uniref:mitochondrial inner membrane protein OXA1-like n=1 Tax=Rutidosis leptorrhynchoides TaxID=125765 RepID=UPI003A9950D3